MIEIAELSPSRTRSITERDPNLRYIVAKGYDTRQAYDEFAYPSVINEYNYRDEEATVFLAREDGTTLGSLTLVRWDEQNEYSHGWDFWSKLRDFDPEFPIQFADEQNFAFNVGGIVVHPEARGRGIGKAMYEQAIDIYNPAIIVGQTKTPGAVMLRSTLPKYRTFYGDVEVTRDAPQATTTDHESLRQAFNRAQDSQFTPGENMVFEYNGKIAPTIPDVSGYPESMQTAFSRVIKAQRTSYKTVMSSLISVRESLLPRHN